MGLLIGISFPRPVTRNVLRTFLSSPVDTHAGGGRDPIPDHGPDPNGQKGVHGFSNISDGFAVSCNFKLTVDGILK